MNLTREQATETVRELVPEVTEEVNRWGANLLQIMAPACSTKDGLISAWKKALDSSTRAPQAGVLREALAAQAVVEEVQEPLTGALIPPMPPQPPAPPRPTHEPTSQWYEV